jgi:hypothetical protein
MPRMAIIWMAAGLGLAGGSGYLASVALSQGSEGPTITTTVNVATGATGPAGPPGPTGPIGPAGGTTCPNGYTMGRLVINHPGGQTAIWTCIEP